MVLVFTLQSTSFCMKKIQLRFCTVDVILASNIRRKQYNTSLHQLIKYLRKFQIVQLLVLVCKLVFLLYQNYCDTMQQTHFLRSRMRKKQMANNQLLPYHVQCVDRHDERALELHCACRSLKYTFTTNDGNIVRNQFFHRVFKKNS